MASRALPVLAALAGTALVVPVAAEESGTHEMPACDAPSATEVISSMVEAAVAAAVAQSAACEHTRAWRLHAITESVTPRVAPALIAAWREGHCKYIVTRIYTERRGFQCGDSVCTEPVERAEWKEVCTGRPPATKTLPPRTPLVERAEAESVECREADYLASKYGERVPPQAEGSTLATIDRWMARCRGGKVKAPRQ